MKHYVYHIANSEYGDMVSAATAGAVSAPTATLFEARASRKQMNISLAVKSMAVAFRGFTPMVFRQVGLAFGMFVIPSWIEQKLSTFVPAAYKETYCKGACSLVGSVIAALLTHYPDTVRVVMQSQQELVMPEACKIAFTRMMSPSGAIACVMRISVLAIAFTTMRLGKKYSPLILNKQESQS